MEFIIVAILMVAAAVFGVMVLFSSQTWSINQKIRDWFTRNKYGIKLWGFLIPLSLLFLIFWANLYCPETMQPVKKSRASLLTDIVLNIILIGLPVGLIVWLAIKYAGWKNFWNYFLRYVVVGGPILFLLVICYNAVAPSGQRDYTHYSSATATPEEVICVTPNEWSAPVYLNGKNLNWAEDGLVLIMDNKGRVYTSTLEAQPVLLKVQYLRFKSGSEKTVRVKLFR